MSAARSTVYLCKMCGDLCPVGIGFAASGTAEESARCDAMDSCPCGYSRAVLRDTGLLPSPTSGTDARYVIEVDAEELRLIRRAVYERSWARHGFAGFGLLYDKLTRGGAVTEIWPSEVLP